MNKTELKQDKLEELREQIYTCLEKAYQKGFEEGTKSAVYSTEDARQVLLRLLAIPSGEYAKMFDDEECYYTRAILSRYSIAEIEERVRAYEEKIIEGDIIYSEMTNSKAIVISLNAWNEWNCINNCGTAFTIGKDKFKYWKKIGHTDELSRLLKFLTESEV